jgi:hypothetical protein
MWLTQHPASNKDCNSNPSAILKIWQPQDLGKPENKNSWQRLFFSSKIYDNGH